MKIKESQLKEYVQKKVVETLKESYGTFAGAGGPGASPARGSVGKVNWECYSCGATKTTSSDIGLSPKCPKCHEPMRRVMKEVINGNKLDHRKRYLKL